MSDVMCKRVKAGFPLTDHRKSVAQQASAAQWAADAVRRIARAWCAVFAVALALAVSCFAAPQQALAYDPDTKPIEVGDVDTLLTLIARSRFEKDYAPNIKLTADIDFNKFDPEGSRLQEIVKAYGSLTFGDKDHPFKGEFNGDGHYIIGLNYKRDFWKPVANTGLFSFTEGAYIHDIHFKDCYIGADYRGGVLVGQAKSTRIESVRMEDCTLSVTPANNSVSLITNAGIMGGLIAGELLDGSSMYNCTAQGGRVVNNSVVAVSGLGGEGLYLGALVGSAEHSQIEYCRVLPSVEYYAARAAATDPASIDLYADNYKYLTEVYNRYEVAVGAVAGQSVYAGGVVGYIKDVDVMDCFSTAWVHTWVANYVGVGAGNIGYVGGIAAISKSDDTADTESNIIRCHYASNMESYQYNALAVIPIIQSNVYLSGLLERDWEEDTNLYNSYFKRSDIVGKDSAIKPYPKGFVRAWGDWLGLNYSGGENGPSAQGFGYGPIVDDAKYADRLFWEGEGYDFEGDEDRASAAINKSHVNKWIMDEYLGIPVHGESVKATADFPGAGDVSISSSTLGKEQKTADPYNFAIQGVTANETELTFTATVNNDRHKNDALEMVSSDANGGFRFQGWFRNGDVMVNHIQQGNHAFFDPMVPPEPQGKQVSGDLEYVATNSGTGADEGARFSDNDLFVAYHQAQVLFHDVKGGVINKNSSQTEVTPQTDDDWYNHQDVLPVVGEPKADREGGEKAPVSDAAKFLGWTTRPNPADTEDGWSNVTVSDLNSMKAAGEFFEGGEPIERPMDLYPVYASLAANINVIAEGHELVSSEHGPNVREGVVEATVTAKNGQYELGIKGLNADGTYTADGALPDGYRFLGWYEVKQDENGEPVVAERRKVLRYTAKQYDATLNNPTEEAEANLYAQGFKVSANPVYTIPDSVDLTQKHCYIARFEYRVDYMVKTPSSEDVTEWDSPVLFASMWEPYCGAFEDIAGPYFYDWRHDHWTLDKLDGCANNDNAKDSLKQGVSSHMYVNGHNVRTGHLDNNYGVDLYTDFPNSADLDSDHLASSLKFTVTATTKKGFQLVGGTWVRNHAWDYTIVDQRFDAPHKHEWEIETLQSTAEYWLEARLVAEVDFMDADASNGQPLKTVTRGYEKYEDFDAEAWTYQNRFQPVLLESDKAYTYRYPVRKGFEDGDVPMSAKECVDKPKDNPRPLQVTSEASPTNDEMQARRPESLFLGWIDKSEIAHGTMTQAEYDTVYDETTRMAKVSLDAITPYLVTDKTLCERPMQLYPVYADYSYETATNITRGTSLTDPANPTVTEVRNPDGTKTLTLSADVDADTAAAYALTSWTVESPEGTVVDTVRMTDTEGNPVEANGTAVSNDNATLKYPIKAGSHYVFVANYEANAAAQLDVTYHVRPSGGADSATEVVAKTAGDPLDRGPVPEFNVADAAFVGWSEQQPADGAEYLMFDVADADKMVDEYTIVERPMELWPVYRVIGTEGDQANVKVNSNIDDTVGTKHRRATVKTAATPQGTQTYVALEADVVDGYKFIGWYKDYVDMTVDPDGKVTVDGTPVPGNRVTGDEMFANNLYTAVYQKMQVYQVVYHFPDMDGADGPLEASTNTIELSADDASAFVQKIPVQKPVIGPDGNPVYNPDGTPQMVDVEVEATVVGGEQTAAMEGFLSKKNDQGQVKELFKEWEWKKQDGSTIAWDGFCRLPIVGSMEDAGVTEMHLYPVTHRLNALDQKGDAYAASNLVWQIDPEALAKDVTEPNAPGAKPAVKIAFDPRTLYLGNKLTIHMAEVHYAADAQPTEGPMNDKLVALYDNFDFTTAKELDRKVTGAGDQGAGNAVFTFDTTGALTIEKTAPLTAAGSTFTFTVTECNEKGQVVQDAKSATVTMTAVGDGSGTATARETISVPWGYYKVVETGWGWRYTPTYQFLEGGMIVEGRPDNVVLVRSQSTAKVTNAPAKDANGDDKDKYLDGEARTKNVFGDGAESMKGRAAR